MPISNAVTRTQQRLDRVPTAALDAVLGTLFVLVGVLTTGATQESGVVYNPRDALASTLILASTVPYFVRRRAPVTVFLITLIAVVVLMLDDYDPGVLPWILLVGAYTVAAYRPPRVVGASAVFTCAMLVVLLVGSTPDFGVGELVSGGGAFGAAMLIGWTMRTRRQRIDSFEDEQAEAERRAAAEERLRIAQELHDVVAHSLGVIAVQAGVGMHVIDSDPTEARRALENISRASRTSLTEIRRLLGMVRDAQGVPMYTPAPGLADIPRLVEGVTRVGLAVDVCINGDVGGVPLGVGVTAYRIVQEALTNTLRHADAHRATVRLDSRSGLLQIEVADDGRGPTGASTGGHGLVGMRERVAVYRGSLDVGAGADGGFRVAAHLPYEEAVGVIRVVVADDQALVRSGFCVLLRTADDIEVVGEAADGRTALQLVVRDRPDVVLMDIRMPEMDGVEATRQITGDARLSSTRVLILTTFDLDEYLFEALRAGASGFLLKDTLPHELLAAVRVVARGDALLAPSLTRRVVEEFARRPAGRAVAPAAEQRRALDMLTPREAEVLAAVARGLSNTEIAGTLFISHATAKTHVSRLLAKLDVRDRAQLVMLAYEFGVVTPGLPGGRMEGSSER